MKVLIACEFSGIVRDAFLKNGHDAISCDLLETDRKGPHYKGDVFDIINDGFDLMIAHPPCTHLCVSGAKHFEYKRTQLNLFEEKPVQLSAIDFFMDLVSADIEKIAIENPIGIMSKIYRKPDQIIHPFEYGHYESKSTCLWLKNLPKLKPSNIVDPKKYRCKCGYIFDFDLGKYGCPNCNGENKVFPFWDNQTPCGANNHTPSYERWKLRSITYQGIANAFASQWG